MWPTLESVLLPLGYSSAGSIVAAVQTEVACEQSATLFSTHFIDLLNCRI